MTTKNHDKDKFLANIEDIKNEINKEFGAGAVFTRKDNTKASSIPLSTGSILLDEAIGNGGFQKGRIVEIYGHESSGKTTITLHVVREFQKQGGIAAFIDVEHALDMEYAKVIGVDIDKLLVSQPNSGEEALSILESLAKKKVGLVILDSVAALVTKAEIEGDIGDSHIGQQARLMSQALKKILSIISESGTLVIFTNQIRSKIGVMFGNPETTCGGNALKFYASVRIDSRKIEMLKNGDEIIGIRVRAKVVKNKCSVPFKEAVIEIRYKEGISITSEILEKGVLYGLIQKSGTWYSIDNKKIGQGKESTLEFLKNNKDVLESLKKTIIEKMKNHHNLVKETSENNDQNDDKEDNPDDMNKNSINEN